PDAAAADAAIRDRAVYGAVLITSAGPEVHVASAAGPTVAQLLTQVAGGLSQQLGQPVPVRDVVPVDPDDPRGTGFGAGFLPLAITSLLAGVFVFLLVRRRAARLVALLAFATMSGLAGAGVLIGWLAILPGSYFAAAGVLALVSLAIAATMTGLAAVLDRGGLALGAVVVFLAGNALSGIGAAPELLPQPWGAVGQWLPIGAGGTLLRSVSYFDGHGAAAAVTVLTAYALGGLLLILAGRRGLVARPVRRSEAEVAPELTPVH
ncbi:MAG TPA: hypothetical protein VGB74_12920, partial [Actinoplanes sp.]